MKRLLFIAALILGVGSKVYASQIVNPSTSFTPGATFYIQSTNALQSGATFYVSSGTVNGNFFVYGPVRIGTGAASGYDSVNAAVSVSRPVDVAVVGHGYADDSTFSSNNATGYASYDARAFVTGSAIGHYVSFQATPWIDVAGSTITTVTGLVTFTNQMAGTVTNQYGLEVYDAIGESSYSGGNVKNSYGIYIHPLTLADTNNWAIYVASNPVYFGNTITTPVGMVFSSLGQTPGPIMYDTTTLNYSAWTGPVTGAISSSYVLRMPTSVGGVANSCFLNDGSGNMGWSQALGTSNSPTFAGLVGTTTNSNASTGNVGEYISSTTAGSLSSFPSAFAWGDVVSVALSSGDWNVSGLLEATANSSNITVFEGGLSTTSGNNSSGLVLGQNELQQLPPSSLADSSISLPVIRFSSSSNFTVYLKFLAGYSAGTPKAYGSIYARRPR